MILLRMYLTYTLVFDVAELDSESTFGSSLSGYHQTLPQYVSFHYFV